MKTDIFIFWFLVCQAPVHFCTSKHEAERSRRSYDKTLFMAKYAEWKQISSRWDQVNLKNVVNSHGSTIFEWYNMNKDRPILTNWHKSKPPISYWYKQPQATQAPEPYSMETFAVPGCNFGNGCCPSWPQRPPTKPYPTPSCWQNTPPRIPNPYSCPKCYRHQSRPSCCQNTPKDLQSWSFCAYLEPDCNIRSLFTTPLICWPICTESFKTISINVPWTMTFRPPGDTTYLPNNPICSEQIQLTTKSSETTVHGITESSTEENKDNIKEHNKEDGQEDTTEVTKIEYKDNTKNNSKENNEIHPKEENENNTNDNSKDFIKESTADVVEKDIKDDSKEDIKENTNTTKHDKEEEHTEASTETNSASTTQAEEPSDDSIIKFK